MNLYAEAEDYSAALLRLIPIHAIVDGKCDCKDVQCPAAGKHPNRSNWTMISVGGEGTLSLWKNAYGCNGFGWALDEDHIVIDVDSRNGGLASLDKLHIDLGINLFESANAIVKTGGNGWHFYFKKLDSMNLGWKMPKSYPGIDIKQFGGFVIIAGSLHISGNEYEWHSAAKSDLENFAIIPEKLSKLLTKTYVLHKEMAKVNGVENIEEMQDMLELLDPSMSHDLWVRVGMAIHNATDGEQKGFSLWDEWSQKSSKYKEGLAAKKWFGFGKYSGEPVKMGTLVQMAKDAGWDNVDPNFLTPEELKHIKENWDRKKESRIVLPSVLEDIDIDLHAPKGLLGDIYDYIYACSAYPNKTLALACSLSTLTNVIGRRYYWPGKFSNIQPNLLILCVAGSSVGKDALIKAAHRILSVCKLAQAIHGRIKSDKDLIDAMERNQYAMYYIDEFGYVLQRINNAIKKGGASYLEGITSTMMEAFTKGDSELLLDLSRKAALREKYEIIITTCTKQLEAGDIASQALERSQKKLNRAKSLMEMHSTGLPNPFLSIFTTATPKSMESAFSGDATENGFLSRAMAFHEFETNPRRKDNYEGTPKIPDTLAWKLRGVSVGYHLDECPFGRIDSFESERVSLKIDHDAQVFVERALDYFYEVAETQKESGLESLPRRALDGIVKICIALAAENGVLTLQMARYAVKLVRVEIDRKIRRVNSTERMGSKDQDERIEGVQSRILEVCNTDRGETPAVILCQVKSGRVNKVVVEQLLDTMTEQGYLEQIDQGRKYGGVQLFRYKSTSKTH